MVQSGGEPRRSPNGKSGAPASRTRWGETLLIWVLVALGGVGLWVSAADPLFGGPEMTQVAFTLFAFFAALGAAATAAIWWWPTVWTRWFKRIPPEGGGRLEAMKLLAGLLFWGLSILAIVSMIASRWHPIAVGAVGGCLVLGRLAVEIWLYHRLGDRRVRRGEE